MAKFVLSSFFQQLFSSLRQARAAVAAANGWTAAAAVSSPRRGKWCQKRGTSKMDFRTENGNKNKQKQTEFK